MTEQDRLEHRGENAGRAQRERMMTQEGSPDTQRRWRALQRGKQLSRLRDVRERMVGPKTLSQ